MTATIHIPDPSDLLGEGLARRLRQLAAAGQITVLDLTAFYDLTESAVTAIAIAAGDALAQGRRLVLLSPSERLRRTAALAGVVRYAPCFRNLAEAQGCLAA